MRVDSAISWYLWGVIKCDKTDASLITGAAKCTADATTHVSAYICIHIYMYVRIQVCLRYIINNSVIFFLGRCTSYRNGYEARNERQSNVESTSAETGAVNSWLGLGYLVSVTLKESRNFMLIAPRHLLTRILLHTWRSRALRFDIEIINALIREVGSHVFHLGTSIQMQYHAKKKLRQNELLRRITPA